LSKRLSSTKTLQHPGFIAAAAAVAATQFLSLLLMIKYTVGKGQIFNID